MHHFTAAQSGTAAAAGNSSSDDEVSQYTGGHHGDDASRARAAPGYSARFSQMMTPTNKWAATQRERPVYKRSGSEDTGYNSFRSNHGGGGGGGDTQAQPRKPEDGAVTIHNQSDYNSILRYKAATNHYQDYNGSNQDTGYNSSTADPGYVCSDGENSNSNDTDTANNDDVNSLDSEGGRICSKRRLP